VRRKANDFNGKIIAEFRANGGKVGGPFEGSNTLLLHHTGARSGRERVSPLAFQWVGDGFARYEVTAAPRKIPVVVLDPVK
jgi:F420H(2)-dependent quinone reductase